jgi:hypothetical protein
MPLTPVENPVVLVGVLNILQWMSEFVHSSGTETLRWWINCRDSCLESCNYNCTVREALLLSLAQSCVPYIVHICGSTPALAFDLFQSKSRVLEMNRIAVSLAEGVRFLGSISNYYCSSCSRLAASAMRYATPFISMDACDITPELICNDEWSLQLPQLGHCLNAV